MSDEPDDFEDLTPPPSGGVGFLLPLATAGAALLTGILLGAALAWIVKPNPEPIEKIVPRDLTAAELEAACAPMVLEKTQEIQVVQDKVDTLTTEVSEKQAKVDELEAEMSRRADRGRALVGELDRLKSELADTKAQLVTAQAEKAQLVEELKATIATLERTEVALTEQKEETRLAKEDSLSNKYGKFISESQLELCERGNRKKLGKCREAVEGYLGQPAVRDRFSHCVRSGQAVPLVRELDKKATLPDYSEFLNQDDKIVKDWYVLFCDPTLPEGELAHEQHLPATAPVPSAPE